MGRVKLIHEKLTYEIRGILYKVHNYLGTYRNEKQYCDAIEYGCRLKGLKCEREKVLDKSFVGEKSCRNRIDFLINDVVIIEVKVVPRLSRNDYHL